MNNRSQFYPALLSVVVLTLALMLLLSGGAGARAMLQVSPIISPTLPVPTFTPADVFPTEPVPTLEPPTSVPLPSTPSASATPRGFLPAPTIINPNELDSLPLAQPAVSGGGPLTEPAELPTAVPADSTVQAAVELLNYLWLLCGGALLIGGAVAIILIWRRGQRT